ncbi:MAG: XdhC family protein [Acetobacteraceae bacterium]|nr:XdhC family protein [Acetobacteraceae bacterium]
MTPALLSALLAAREAKKPVVLATRLPDGAQTLLPDDRSGSDPVRSAALAALADDATREVAVGSERWLFQPYNPPLRLVVVGAVHIAQALVALAPALGFAATVVDPRRSFATPERFPGIALSDAWPDEAMATLGPDSRTAVVTLTHDPKLDDPALDRALRSEAFYVGALGSRKTHAARLDRFRALGHGEAALARIHGPIGLAIGAVTAPEIALSVVAQIVAVRRRAVAA